MSTHTTDFAVPKQLTLGRYVPGLLLWLTNKMSSSASRLYRDAFDVGVTDWRVLAFIAVKDHCTSVDICNVVGLNKAAVSRSVALLEEAGLLRTKPLAGRSIQLDLTAKGRRLYGRMLVPAVRREEALLTGFSDSERELLIQFLHRLLANLPVMNAIGSKSDKTF